MVHFDPLLSLWLPFIHGDRAWLFNIPHFAFRIDQWTAACGISRRVPPPLSSRASDHWNLWQ
jgi:hypothetical protein